MKYNKGIVILSVSVIDRATDGFNRQILHSIETVVIDWAHQIRTVLKRDSSEALLQGTNPLPQVEFEFWRTRLDNLECIYEQVP